MGLFDRISQVVRSNLNAAISSAEDPEKILEQTVIDMQEDLVQLRQAVAQAIASQKRLEQQYNQNQNQASEWERRARLALQKGEENLAREALNRKKSHADTANALKAQLDQSTAQVDNLRRQMTAMEGKLAEAKTKKDMLTARARAAKATEQINQTLGKVNTSSAGAAFERMEDKVLQMEARSQAVAELAGGDNLESQFAQLEAGGDVDDELLRLKAELAGGGVLPPASQGTAALPASQEPARQPVDPELERLRNEINRG
uniref:Phage shock protein A, PspA n=1 Tax=Cyanothece sp. (strain PCC 7425 / ATCC 29141) TaxID=395961 RepID=B8HPD4_CYAP4